MTKKSQMEILGLAVVVVLILLALVFVVKFLVVKKPVDYRKSAVSSEIASNMINTYLKTSSIDCSYATMTELLQDCAEGPTLTCNDAQNSDSCKFAENSAKTIFSKTLEKWKIRYYFEAYLQEYRPLIKVKDQCQGQKKSKLFPIPTDAGTMYVKLDLCG